MKICLFGNKALTREFLKYCYGEEVHIDSLISVSTNKDSSRLIAGFDANLQEYANDHGTRIYLAPKYSLNDEASLNYINEEKFDLGISLGWQRLIPDEILETFGHGVFGWHGSMFEFPNGRGRSPINWSIRLGGEIIHLNFFRYDAGVDTGQLYETIEVPILQSDYISDVQAKVLEIQKGGFSRLLKSMNEGKLRLTNQPGGPFIDFPKLTEETGLIEVSKMTRKMALNIVRSCSSPFPGAFAISECGNFKLRIWKARLAEDTGQVPETSSITKNDNDFYLRFVDGLLLVTEYQIVHGEYADTFALR